MLGHIQSHPVGRGLNTPDRNSLNLKFPQVCIVGDIKLIVFHANQNVEI